MRVLVADKFPEDGLAALRAAGLDVRYEPGVKGEALAAAVRDSGARGAGGARHRGQGGRAARRAASASSCARGPATTRST